MKKTYIAPAVTAAQYSTGVLMEGSMNVDTSKSTSGSSGGWTRQMWVEDEEEAQ